MATATATLLFSNNNDTEFRTWGSQISTQLAAMGLVQTADTGQVNWTTVTKPGGANTSGGYEIWRFNDVLQASAAVYFRIDYGTANSPVRCQIWIQFGHGSNGSGTLTGTLSTQVACSHSSQTASSTFYFSGASGRFGTVIGRVDVNTTTFFSFERTKNSDGTDSTEGVLFCAYDNFYGWRQYAWNIFTGMASGVEGSVGALLPSVGSGTSGTQVSLYPVWHQKGVFFNPGISTMIYFNSDTTALTPISMSVYGATHTYLPIGSVAISVGAPRAATATSVAMRWE